MPATAATPSRLAVGDSLMVSVTPWMRAQGFRVHAKVGRQFSTAPGIVRSFGSKLPRNVVVELGTNGTVSLSACRSVVNAAGKYRRVFLVTPRVPRSWEAGNIRTLRACDASFSARRVRIIDWHTYSAEHSEWFAADRVHLSSSGREGLLTPDRPRGRPSRPAADSRTALLPAQIPLVGVEQHLGGPLLVPARAGQQRSDGLPGRVRG